MVVRGCVCVWAAICGLSASAVTTLFDFETEDERLAAPNVRTESGTVIAVTNAMAPNGSFALHVRKPVWKEGNPDVTGVRFELKPGVTNWREYDRLVMDVFNDGPSGDWMYVRAVGPDDKWEDGLFGRLALPARSYIRWTVPLKWPKGFDPSCVTRMLVNTSSRPQGFDVRLDGIRLLRPGESAPVATGELFSQELMARHQKRIAVLEQSLAEEQGARRHDKAVQRFVDICEKAGTRHEGFCLGQVSSAEQVLPRDGFDARPAKSLRVRLARNEWESIQLVVVPTRDGLRNVRVSVSDLHMVDGAVFASSNIQVEVVGFVRTTRPCYPVKTVGWWPDPLLSFIDGVDIAGNDAQSFYLRVKCPRNQFAGTYSGRVRIGAEGCPAVDIPLSVRVNGFTLPDGPALPMLISFKPIASPRLFSDAEYAKLTSDPCAPINIWRRHNGMWTDFLSDYNIARGNLYAQPPWGPDFEALARLKTQGRIGWFNLGYWPPFGAGRLAAESWRETYLPGLRRNYEKAKALGLLEWACLYGADEVHPGSFDRVAGAAAEIAREFPDIPISTTSFDAKYGIDGSKLSAISWFTPKVAAYDPIQAEKARREGKQVWWYTCDIPLPPYPTSYIETPVIVTRLLMGAMTAKFRPDGYLYYSVSHWNAKKPIMSGPFTDWPALSLPPDFNGDGCWMCVGPDGIPLSTLRLENFRDGLEDFAYVKLLEARGEKIEVPESVVKSVADYTFDPCELSRWRDSLADRLERHFGEENSTR